jgi:hypothetical protein
MTGLSRKDARGDVVERIGARRWELCLIQPSFPRRLDARATVGAANGLADPRSQRRIVGEHVGDFDTLLFASKRPSRRCRACSISQE